MGIDAHAAGVAPPWADLPHIEGAPPWADLPHIEGAPPWAELPLDELAAAAVEAAAKVEVASHASRRLGITSAAVAAAPAAGTAAAAAGTAAAVCGWAPRPVRGAGWRDGCPAGGWGLIGGWAEPATG